MAGPRLPPRQPGLHPTAAGIPPPPPFLHRSDTEDTPGGEKEKVCVCDFSAGLRRRSLAARLRRASAGLPRYRAALR